MAIYQNVDKSVAFEDLHTYGYPSIQLGPQLMCKTYKKNYGAHEVSLNPENICLALLTKIGLLSKILTGQPVTVISQSILNQKFDCYILTIWKLSPQVF